MSVHDRTIAAGQPPGLAWLRRVAPAGGVFLLAPLTAEYLAGYDSSTGDLGALLFGLLFFAPLYGAPALIIREVARRTGRGWPSMLLLAAAFGVTQAGLVDQSLFNLAYSDTAYWAELFGPTYIPALGIGAYPALDFISGHVIWSISLPIAIFEAFVPSRQTTPWLGKLGLAIMVVLYLLASAAISVGHVDEQQFLASAPQLIGAAATVVVCIGAAFVLGRQPRPQVKRPTPSPWRAGAAAFVMLSLPFLVEVVLALLEIDTSFGSDWWGFAMRALLLAGLAFLTARWSRREGWGVAHPLALAGGALLTRVWLAFLIEPLGYVPPEAKLLHNTVFALGAVALLAIVARRAHS